MQVVMPHPACVREAACHNGLHLQQFKSTMAITPCMHAPRRAVNALQVRKQEGLYVNLKKTLSVSSCTCRSASRRAFLSS